MDAMMLFSFSAIFYAFVKKGLAFGSTFVSRVAALAPVYSRVFFLSRSRFLFVDDTSDLGLSFKNGLFILSNIHSNTYPLQNKHAKSIA